MKRISKCLPWRPSWILEGKDFSILNLHALLMPQMRFQLNLANSSGGDVKSERLYNFKISMLPGGLWASAHQSYIRSG